MLRSQEVLELVQTNINSNISIPNTTGNSVVSSSLPETLAKLTAHWSGADYVTLPHTTVSLQHTLYIHEFGTLSHHVLSVCIVDKMHSIVLYTIAQVDVAKWGDISATNSFSISTVLVDSLFADIRAKLEDEGK